MTKSLFVRPMLARTAMVVMAATLVSGCAGLSLPRTSSTCGSIATVAGAIVGASMRIP